MSLRFIKEISLSVVLAITLIGCSSAPEKTDAQKSFEETQQRIKDVQSSMTSVSLPPRVAPEGWAKKFCSLDFGFEKERVREIMGEPIYSGPVTVVYGDKDVASEDKFVAGAYNFTVEYDSAGNAVLFSSGSAVPCDDFRTNLYGSQP